MLKDFSSYNKISFTLQEARCMNIKEIFQYLDEFIKGEAKPEEMDLTNLPVHLIKVETNTVESCYEITSTRVLRYGYNIEMSIDDMDSTKALQYKMELVTDLFIGEVRMFMKRFFQKDYPLDHINNPREHMINIGSKLGNTILSLIIILLNTVKISYWNRAYAKNLMIDELYKAARSYCFLGQFFRIRESFDKTGIKPEAYYPQLSEFMYSIMQAEETFNQEEQMILKSKIIDITHFFRFEIDYDYMNLAIGKEASILDRIYNTANDYFIHMRERVTHTICKDEAMEKMLDLLIDYIRGNREDNLSNVVTVFASFQYLLYSRVMEKYMYDEDYLSELYNYNNLYDDKILDYLEAESLDEKFIYYLDLVWNHKWDKAINKFSNYGIPYYYKILYILKDVDNLELLNETVDRNLPEIKQYIEKLDDYLYNSLYKKEKLYLPSLYNNPFFPDVDLKEVIELHEKAL